MKFDSIEINNKEFQKAEQTINLKLIDINKIVISDKFKHSDDGFKYFIGSKGDDIVRQLCIILPQMSGYILKIFWKRRKKYVFYD